MELLLAAALTQLVRSVSVQPVGTVLLALYFTGVVQPAMILFWKYRLIDWFGVAGTPVILISVGVPVVASINKPTGHPIITELKIEIAELRRICAPFLNKEFPTLLLAALGPIMV